MGEFLLAEAHGSGLLPLRDAVVDNVRRMVVHWRTEQPIPLTAPSKAQNFLMRLADELLAPVYQDINNITWQTAEELRRQSTICGYHC